jgi:hypothetical protein
MTGLSIDEARRKLSGLHFAKEALSPGEREILYIAEGLMRLIDEPENLPEVRDLVQRPGVLRLDLYVDGVEVVGSPNDSDESVGFVKGTFTVEELRSVVGPHMPIHDNC